MALAVPLGPLMFAVFLWRAGWSYDKASTFFDTFFIRKNLESDQTFSTPKHIHHACTSLETCSWHWGHHQSLYHLAIKVSVSSEQPLCWSCYSVWFGDSRDSWTSLYSNMLTEDFVCHCLRLRINPIIGKKKRRHLVLSEVKAQEMPYWIWEIYYHLQHTT